MNKGLESLKVIVESNIEKSRKQIERYLNMETPEIWIRSISYFEGIKSTNESLLKCIEHEYANFEFTNMRGPFVIKPLEGDSYLYMVLPMELKNKN